MIEITVSTTTKGYHPSARWERSGDDSYQFRDMAEAKAWLTDRYGTSKRHAMYRDKKGGPTVRCGYVIGFRVRDWDYNYLQQDWVSFYEVLGVDLDADT